MSTAAIIAREDQQADARLERPCIAVHIDRRSSIVTSQAGTLRLEKAAGDSHLFQEKDSRI